jgi:CRP/FNR family transcriptional regulator, cyclic AMP receptor protein
MDGTESGNGFWQRLSETDRVFLSVAGRVTHYQSGAVICTEGEPANHVFILITGWAKVSALSDDGREFVLALRGQGDIIGELGEASGYRTATVQAVADVQSLLVPHQRFGSFLEAHPDASRVYRGLMTQRWGEASSMLLRRSTSTGPQRLAALLLDLADRHGTATSGGTHIEMPLSQEELASLAGTSRSTLARALANWRGRGFIRTGYRQITIISTENLRRIAR